MGGFYIIFNEYCSIPQSTNVNSLQVLFDFLELICLLMQTLQQTTEFSKIMILILKGHNDLLRACVRAWSILKRQRLVLRLDLALLPKFWLFIAVTGEGDRKSSS